MRIFSGRAKGVFAVALQRQTRYGPMIRQRLKARGLPENLTYLALVESWFNPHAYSRAAAVGIWQFMAGTGRGMGLRVDWWVDERRDPVRSTDAAARLLVGLRNRFGSLYLAAAAYNGGEGRVSRGLARSAAGWRRRNRRPVERRISHGVVVAIGAVDRIQHQHAIFHRSTHRPNLVHRPAERHGAVAADAPVGGAQPGDAVGDRGRDDRAERLGADREADQSGGRGCTRTGRRSARAALGVPGIAGRAAEPQCRHVGACPAARALGRSRVRQAGAVHRHRRWSPARRMGQGLRVVPRRGPTAAAR